MNIREHIEKNPFVYLIGIVVATVGISISADQYFCQKAANLLKAQHKLEVDQLHTRLASIDRRISGGDFLDIRSMAISKAERKEVPINSEYNSELKAYVAKGDNFWVYERMKRAEYDLKTIESQKWFSDKTKDSMRKSHFYINSPVIHLWSRKDYTYISSVNFADFSLVSFPHVAIQKMSITDYLKKYKLSVTLPSETDEDMEQEKTKHISLELLNKYYRGDIAGVLFVDQWQHFQRLNDMAGQFRDSIDMQLELRAAQKIGNILYCQLLGTFNNVLVNKQSVRQYYLHMEFFIFLTKESIYTIWSIMPTEDPLPRGKYSSNITQWFSDLAILID